MWVGESCPLHTVAWVAQPVGWALRPHAPQPVPRVSAFTPGPVLASRQFYPLP